MGGDKFTAVRTIVATGRTRRVRGDNLVPIEFEINIELPDKYVRKDEVPAEESQPTSTGFVGNEIVQFPLAPAGRGRGDAPPPPPAGRGRGDAPAAPPAGGGRGPAAPPTPEQLEAQRAARLTTAKQEFARLMLGLLPSTLEAYPLTFGYAAQAAAPQGTADVLDVRGAGNFAARLFLASDTKLPIMVSWQAPPTAVLVRTPGGPAPPSVPPGAVFVDAPPPPGSRREPRGFRRIHEAGRGAAAESASHACRIPHLLRRLPRRRRREAAVPAAARHRRRHDRGNRRSIGSG